MKNILFGLKGGLVSSPVSILINGSPTKEFRRQRGLRHGDSITPFLFLLVSKDLSDLIHHMWQ